MVRFQNLMAKTSRIRMMLWLHQGHSIAANSLPHTLQSKKIRTTDMCRAFPFKKQGFPWSSSPSLQLSPGVPWGSLGSRAALQPDAKGVQLRPCRGPRVLPPLTVARHDGGDQGGVQAAAQQHPVGHIRLAEACNGATGQRNTRQKEHGRTSGDNG